MHAARFWAGEFSPTWRVRPSVQLFLGRKPLICRGEVPPKWSKLAVVKTHAVPKRAAMSIIGGRYVPALHDTKEERQRAPLLQPDIQTDFAANLFRNKLIIAGEDLKLDTEVIQSFDCLFGR